MSKIEIPELCPYCGHEVVFTSAEELYRQKKYANIKIYLCRNCTASVGVHKGTNRPLGVMATKEMKGLKRACHDLFDATWKSGILHRNTAYGRLSDLLGIPRAECHIGYFKTDMLLKTLEILANPDWYKKSA